MIQMSQFLAWGLKHVEIVEAAFATMNKLSTAENAVEKWGAVKPLGDLLAPAIDDFPAFSFGPANDDQRIEKLCAMLNARAAAAETVNTKFAWNRQTLQQVLNLINLILPLIAAR